MATNDDLLGLAPEAFNRRVELQRLALEQEKVRLDDKRSQLDNRWMVRMFPALITAAVSVAGALISWSQVRSAEIGKARELEVNTSNQEQERGLAAREADRKWGLDVLRFISDNFDRVFSPDPAKRNQMRAAMMASLPDSLAYVVFSKLAASAPDSARGTWTSAKSDAAKRLGTRVFLHFKDEADRPRIDTLASDLEAGGWNVRGAERIGDQIRADARFFFAEDRATADSLVHATSAVLKRMGYTAPIKQLFLAGLSNQTAPGTIEIWLPKLP